MPETRIDQPRQEMVADDGRWRPGWGVLPLAILIVAAVGMRITLQHHKAEVASIRGDCDSLAAAAESARDSAQRLANERKDEIARLGPRLSSSEQDNRQLLADLEQTRTQLTESLASTSRLEQELTALRVRFEKSETAARIQLARADEAIAHSSQELTNARNLFEEYRAFAEMELTETMAMNTCLQDELAAVQTELAEVKASSHEEMAAARSEQNRLTEALRAIERCLEGTAEVETAALPPNEEPGPMETQSGDSWNGLWPAGQERFPPDLLLMPTMPTAEILPGTADDSPGPDIARIPAVIELRVSLAARMREAERMIGRSLEWLREIKESSRLLRDDRGLLGKQADASRG